MYCENLGWRVYGWVAIPKVLQLFAPGMSADAGDMRSHAQW
ncbi:hypothetical protein [Nostoc sp. FACHB-190]|nr:hypothetical protein [Nostoc sp. FACHB-190]